MERNRVTKLFGIQYPIIQGGMIWCSGWELASAVSNSGGLGILGSGSMYPEELKENIAKVQKATDKPFAVNIPLLYPDVDKHIESCIKLKVPIVFTSAGNPDTWTRKLQKEGIKVVHVVSSTRFAMKAELSGVDAIVAEGFEAGGHNGREETTSMCLLPPVSKKAGVPVIAAGGIGCGRSMMAAFALGAEGVQIGSRFAICKESSAHANFKNYVRNSREGDTKLMLKQLTPVRLMRNDFFDRVHAAELSGADEEELKELLGRGRAKKGMYEGDLIEGELEIGQISANLKDEETASEIIASIWNEFLEVKSAISRL